eukprot:s5629_g6.t1
MAILMSGTPPKRSSRLSAVQRKPARADELRPSRSQNSRSQGDPNEVWLQAVQPQTSVLERMMVALEVPTEEHDKLLQQLTGYRPGSKDRAIGLEKAAEELDGHDQEGLRQLALPVPQRHDLEHIKPPPTVDLLTLPGEDRRPSTSSSRVSPASSPASTPRQDHRAFGSLPAIPDSRGEDDHNGAASAADVVSKQPSRHVKIGDTEEIEEHGSKRVSTVEASNVLSMSQQLTERLQKVITGAELAAVMQRNRRFAPRKEKSEFTKERMEDIIREMRVIAARKSGISFHGSTGGGAAREVGAAIRGAMREVPPVVRYGRAVREVRGVREVPRGRDMGCGAGGSTGGEAFGEGGYIGGRPDSGSGAGDGVWCERLRGDSPKRSISQQHVISWLSFVELIAIPDLPTQAARLLVDKSTS